MKRFNMLQVGIDMFSWWGNSLWSYYVYIYYFIEILLVKKNNINVQNMTIYFSIIFLSNARNIQMKTTQTKQQAIEVIKEVFKITEHRLQEQAKKGDIISSFLYNQWKNRGYYHLSTEDLYNIKELDLSMLGMYCLLDEFG